MLEQQLVDYIKKAKEAGQSESQTRSLLYKNGWTEAEVGDAFASLNQPRPQPQVQPQARPQAQPIQAQPEIKVAQAVQPQVQQQSPKVVAVNPAQNNIMRPKNKLHTILKISIALIIVVVLCGAGLFAAGQYFNLPWNPFWPNPATVMSKMMANMQNVKSNRTKVQGEISVTSDSKESLGKLTFSTDTQGDITDIKNPKANVAFTMNLTSPMISSEASATISMISLGTTFYYKIDKIVIPSDYSYPGLDVSQFAGRWFKVDQDSVKALSQISGNSAGGQIGMLNISQANNSALVKKIRDIISSESVLSIDKQLADATVAGQNTYHYMARIKKDKLGSLINKMIDLQMQETAKAQTPGNTISASDLALEQSMLKSFATTIVDAIGDVNIEIWVGKKDNMLYQARLDKVVDLKKIVSIAKGQVELKLSMVNSDFDKIASIQAPEGAQKIEDAILPLLKKQKIETDMSQVAFLAGSLYSTGKNYSAFCSPAFLSNKTYGPALKTAIDDIKKQGASNLACFSGIQSYCVSAQLADGSYMCIDKNNKLGITKCVNFKTVCK
ncbi:MAG: hypothetical protein NT155_04615 [Candidatus Staskawiczbacteria bacterium]|nr:hypothetical protein [Candidatus Staskawiczbacteria bacterium]